MTNASPCAMIETRYLGPTNYRGARVVARNVNTRTRKVVSWDHAIGAVENHERAAVALYGAPPAYYSSVGGGGYIFAMTSR